MGRIMQLMCVENRCVAFGSDSKGVIVWFTKDGSCGLK